MTALEILINSLNSQIEEFNKSNYKIYDSENPNWYLNKVRYDKEGDSLVFDCKEDTLQSDCNL